MFSSSQHLANDDTIGYIYICNIVLQHNDLTIYANEPVRWRQCLINSDNNIISDNMYVSENVSDKMLVVGHLSDNVSDNEEVSDNMSDNEEMSDNMSDNIHRDTILKYLAEYNEINTATAAKLIGRNPKTARRLLLKMINDGIISATGANRNRKYKMVKKQ